MKIDLFDFLIDARKLRRLLKDMYETGEIKAHDYFLIEDQILLHSDSLEPKNESVTIKNGRISFLRIIKVFHRGKKDDTKLIT